MDKTLFDMDKIVLHKFISPDNKPYSFMLHFYYRQLRDTYIQYFESINQDIIHIQV